MTTTGRFANVRHLVGGLREAVGFSTGHLVGGLREAVGFSTGHLGLTLLEGRIAAPPMDFSCA
ncbi:hypothetical protein [Streptomyces sp. NBC_00425]|uniref:hypothetical protein n=1 Tax=Streptomyces sp. NBC_00425 TaxID=2975740 RepID=UPI002E23453B